MPPSGTQSTPTILTRRPYLWRNMAAHSRASVVDLSSLLGSWSRISDSRESGMASVIHDFLLDAGWPQSSIAGQYRPDLKSPVVLDFVLLGPDGDPFMAIEVKPGRYLAEGRRLDDTFEQLADRAMPLGVEWLGVAGDEFIVRDVVSGQEQRFSRPPSPADLGHPELGSPAMWASPDSWSALDLELAATAGDWLIIDFTILLGMPRDNPHYVGLKQHVSDLSPELRDLARYRAETPNCLSCGRRPCRTSGS